MSLTLAYITGTPGTVFVNGTSVNVAGVIASRPAIVHSFVLVGGGGSGTGRLYNSSNSTGTAATMAIAVAGTNLTNPSVITAPAVFNLGVLCTLEGTAPIAMVIFE